MSVFTFMHISGKFANLHIFNGVVTIPRPGILNFAYCCDMILLGQVILLSIALWAFWRLSKISIDSFFFSCWN